MFICPHCKKPVTHLLSAVMDTLPYDDGMKHYVRAYCCSHDDCGVILGLAPEPDEFLGDAVAASQDAESSILCEMRKQSKKDKTL